MKILEIVLVTIVVLASIIYLVVKFYKKTKNKSDCICDGSCGKTDCASFKR